MSSKWYETEKKTEKKIKNSKHIFWLNQNEKKFYKNKKGEN